MHAVICKIGPFTVYSYGLMLAVAFLVSIMLAKSEARKLNINPEVISNLAFLVLIFGVIGARIFYILENIGFYIKFPQEMIMLQRGGLSWFGGFFLSLAVTILYLKNKRLPIYKVLDLLAPYIALGQAMGRIGCFLNGCCYGKVSRFGIYFKVHNQTLIPTQLYSSLLLIIIFIILRFLQNRPHRTGEVFFMYLLLYSIKRFLIEFLRADNVAIFWDLSLFQILSVWLFFLAVFKLIFIKRNKS